MKKNDLNKKCTLNPTALLVRGISRCVVCDLERNSYTLAPVSLYEILTQNKDGFTIQEISEQYSEGEEQNRKIILSYFKALLRADLLVFTNFPEYYQPINMTWDFPGDISNAVIDIDKNTTYVTSFLEQITQLGCPYIQLRFFQNYPLAN